ncbi:MAG: 4-hydroxy-tetrahydrodipicolinate reductase [Desulfonauticus sp.]|nr:4-hydroxy-tetrahydrodipicolinate reductase [Desulfonauticus sp.]
MVEIIVLGAKGRMGSTISRLVKQDRDFLLRAVLEKEENLESLSKEYPDVWVGSELDKALEKYPQAVVIDFTAPAVSLDTIKICLKTKARLVMGTTGFKEKELIILQEAAKQIPFLWAPNMSVGINVLLKILPELVRLLGSKYDLEISEIHHRLKKDAPSGTALKLAQCLAEARGVELKEVARYCREGLIGERSDGEIGVQTLRGGDVVGDHTVYFLGPGERIEITHRAHSRETFAQGSLRAAKWLASQAAGRLYSMADVLT